MELLRAMLKQLLLRIIRQVVQEAMLLVVPLHLSKLQEHDQQL